MSCNRRRSDPRSITQRRPAGGTLGAMHGHPRSFWTKLVADVETGATLADTAARHGVNVRTLTWRASRCSWVASTFARCGARRPGSRALRSPERRRSRERGAKTKSKSIPCTSRSTVRSARDPTSSLAPPDDHDCAWKPYARSSNRSSRPCCSAWRRSRSRRRVRRVSAAQTAFFRHLARGRRLRPMPKAAEWEGRVAAWKSSGLSRRDFARSMGYSPSTLGWWTTCSRPT